MSTAGAMHPSFEVAVGEDGSIMVPADEVARLGLKPGARLRLVAEQASPLRRRSSWGVLAGKVPELSWEDFKHASRLAVVDHEARYCVGGRWDRSISQA